MAMHATLLKALGPMTGGTEKVKQKRKHTVKKVSLILSKSGLHVISEENIPKSNQFTLNTSQ